ncbi:hypothetical protein Pelo_2861 [Pelomyxa schiedti]|nr:hypothetical protein Pelo_2861 [Pelomyxa schiedti]
MSLRYGLAPLLPVSIKPKKTTVTQNSVQPTAVPPPSSTTASAAPKSDPKSIPTIGYTPSAPRAKQPPPPKALVPAIPEQAEVPPVRGTNCGNTPLTRECSLPLCTCGASSVYQCQCSRTFCICCLLLYAINKRNPDLGTLVLKTLPDLGAAEVDCPSCRQTFHVDMRPYAKDYFPIERGKSDTHQHMSSSVFDNELDNCIEMVEKRIDELDTLNQHISEQLDTFPKKLDTTTGWIETQLATQEKAVATLHTYHESLLNLVNQCKEGGDSVCHSACLERLYCAFAENPLLNDLPIAAKKPVISSDEVLIVGCDATDPVPTQLRSRDLSVQVAAWVIQASELLKNKGF